MKKFPKAKIPFPVRPGDTVFFLVEDGDATEIVAETVEGAGIDDESRLFVCRGDAFVMFGAEGRLFFTEEDAKAFANDPQSLPHDYGTVDYDGDALPFYPGQEIYYPDYDPLFDRWQILESYCTQVVFKDDGSVEVYDDTGGSDTVVGERAFPFPPFFDSPRKARAYVRKQGYGRFKS